MAIQPDVVLKGVGERVAWKCTGSFTNRHVITAHRQLGVQQLITFNLCLVLLAQIHGRCLLDKDSASPSLPEIDDQCAASTLCTFFDEKIQTIRTGLEAEEKCSEHQPSYFVGETLSEFSPVSEDQLAKIKSKCKPTSTGVDPIPTSPSLPG